MNLHQQFPGSVVNSPVNEAEPSISADGLAIFFSDSHPQLFRPAGNGNADIWVSTRNNPDDPFGEPINLNSLGAGSEINTPSFEGIVSVSSDWPAHGSEIFFVSERFGSMGWDIYSATWLIPSEIRFRRGDSNADAVVDVSDAVNTLFSLFLGSGEIPCEDAADANDDGLVDVSDPTTTLEVLFLSEGMIPAPGTSTCGVDPNDDGLDCRSVRACGV